MSKKGMAEFQKRMYEDAIRRQNNQNNNEVFKIFLVLGCWCLHENHNWGYAKLEGFMNKMNETLDDINDGNIIFDDVVDVIEEECGITVTNRHRIKPWND